MMSGGAISCSFRKQPIITLSTTEVEFFATAACACQAIWMRRILKEIGHVKAAGTKLICVNSSTTKLSKNPVLYGCSKNIRIRFHFLRDLAIEGVVNLLFCSTQDQFADLLTKPLKVEAFQKLRKEFGMSTISNLS